MMARTEEVLHGTTRRFAEAQRPVTFISRWRLMILSGFAVLAQFSASRSGEASNEDQLMLIAMISPRRLDRAAISSGSSRAIEAVCGHHPPSRGAPNSIAKASRTGLAKRRPYTAPFMALTTLRPERRAGRLAVDMLASTKSAPPLGNPTMTHVDSSMILHFGLIRHASAGIGNRNQSLMIIPVGVARGSMLATKRSPSTLHPSRRNTGYRAPAFLTAGDAGRSGQRPRKSRARNAESRNENGQFGSGRGWGSASMLP